MKNIKYTYKVLQILIVTLISFSLFQISFAQENVNGNGSKNVNGNSLKNETANENRLKNANEKLEAKKKEIIDKIKKREIEPNEGKELLIQEKEKIINSTKADLRVEKKENEDEKAKNLIASKLNPRLQVFDSLAIEKQVLLYEKLIEKLEKESNKPNLKDKKKMIIDMMIEIIEGKKNNLSS